MTHLAIALMGPFEAALDGKPITWFQSDKARALLAYLAVEAATPHARHALAGLLWPEVPDAHALHSLSQALCNLRTILHDQTAPTPCFIVTSHAIQAALSTHLPIDRSTIASPSHLFVPRPLPGGPGAG